jgi:V/A-type H+-transporting ATPase subunit D
MAKIRFTKNALREEQKRLNQLESYLPTLQLKKKLLQVQVTNTEMRIKELLRELEKQRSDVEEFSHLLTDKTNSDILKYVEIEHVEKSYENIAGVEIPEFESVSFRDESYFLFDTPIWMDVVLEKLRDLVSKRQNIFVEEEKKRALLKELKEVSIRVNLFEKILIPRALQNIKKIKIFLGDQELAAVSQAKVAKKKILERKVI